MQLLQLQLDDISSISPAAVVKSARQDPPSLSANASLVKERAAGRQVSAERAGDVLAALVRVEDDTGLPRHVLDATLDDIAQRYDLLRQLNQSVHDALGLLDLTAWRDPSSSAAHLSECSGLLFGRFKILPIWLDVDVLSSTKRGHPRILGGARLWPRHEQAPPRRRARAAHRVRTGVSRDASDVVAHAAAHKLYKTCALRVVLDSVLDSVLQSSVLEGSSGAGEHWRAARPASRGEVDSSQPWSGARPAGKGAAGGGAGAAQVPPRPPPWLV